MFGCLYDHTTNEDLRPLRGTVRNTYETQKELMQTGDTRTSKQKRDQELSDFLGTLKF